VFVSHCRYFAPVRNQNASKSTGIKNRGQISNFLHLFLKISQGMGEISKSIFQAQPRKGSNLWCTFGLGLRHEVKIPIWVLSAIKSKMTMWGVPIKWLVGSRSLPARNQSSVDVHCCRVVQLLPTDRQLTVLLMSSELHQLHPRHNYSFSCIRQPAVRITGQQVSATLPARDGFHFLDPDITKDSPPPDILPSCLPLLERKN